MLSVDKINNLKAENERLKSEVGKLTQTCGSLLNIQYTLADSCKKYSETLQEIKDIVETELSYDMVENERKHYRNYDIIRYKIAKAEEENE